MGNRPSQSRKQLVENCEVISATLEDLRVCCRVGIDTCATMPKPFESFRHWFKCPSCGRRSYKLYRPDPPSGFACRACHNLTYRSAQKQDARCQAPVAHRQRHRYVEAVGHESARNKVGAPREVLDPLLPQRLLRSFVLPVATASHAATTRGVGHFQDAGSA